MINFIFGSYGSGKTTEIFKRIYDDTKAKKRCFLIIPDHEAVQFERLSLSLLEPSAQLYLEILSFSRLYNRVCREYGGLSYSYITKPIRSLVMWKSLRDLRPLLKEYANDTAFDSSLTELMLSTVGEFKAAGISAGKIEMAAKKLDGESSLSKRLYDLSLIYACYDNLVSERYSDSADDLAKLDDILKENDFFAGANVYIDSFSSYTAVQHRVIDRMFGGADNVFITVPLANKASSGISCESVARSYKTLRKHAERYGVPNEMVLGGNLRSSSAAISYLANNLWQMDSTEGAPTVNGDIICEVCANPYTEAEALAAHILKLLKDGARCRDIAIIMRDADKYRGIIEPALKNSGIPFFFAEKSDLCSLPAIKFILSALKIKRFGWQSADVISHLTTGLCDVDARDANLFEEYVNTWRIHGDRFFEEWTMNPDGFVKERSARAENILSRANEVRKKLVEPLLKLFVLIDAADTVADMCRAIYAYIDEVSLEDKLSALATKAAERGDVKQARELSRIYGVILNSLADIINAIGDEIADSEELMLILKTVFDKTEIGSIPTSIDEVTIGYASMLRSANQKYAFVLGLCEGEFPAAVKDDGLFCQSDRDKLGELGLELSTDVDSRSADELMFVERAFSVPSERLYLFTHKAEISGSERFPSLAFNRVKKLFSDVVIHEYRPDDFDYIVPAPKNAISTLRTIENTELKHSLALALEDYVPNVSKNALLSLDGSESSVEPSTLSEFTGSSIYFSPSSFEKYVKCPLSYYCSNILELRETKTADFNAADMGTFIHFVLEELLRNSIPKNADEAIADDETIIERTDAAVREYIESICPAYLLDSNRMKHLYARLKSLSLLLIKNIVEEFSKSLFRPAFFELRSNGVGENPTPLVFRLKDGTRVTFGGIVDRVDVYKQGEKVYLRVVDYKTGTKNFSLEDVDHGLNMQMLLYLFTLCRSRSESFRASIGCEGDEEALPAGVIYLSANIPLVETDDYTDEQEVIRSATERLERSGLLFDNEEILLAMNQELDSDFLAGIKKRAKDGALTGSALTSAEEFADIYSRLEKVIIKISEELRSGKANASPLRYGKTDPCEYCQAKPICRRTKI